MVMFDRLIRALSELLGSFGNCISYRVSGRVAGVAGNSTGELTVIVVDKSVGGDVTLAQGQTAADGTYSLAFSDAALRRSGKDRPDLQAQVYAGDRLVGTSEVRYDAGAQETLDILLPAEAATALASEHETLTADLARHHSGPLAGLEENEERRDLTYLAGKTGWDARAVALASLADQFSARAGQADIEPALFYALFRAGIPANEATLYRTPPETVEGIWRQALAQGVIPAELEPRLGSARAGFERIASERLLDGPPPAGTSPLKDLLSPTLDPAQQRLFADLQAQHRDSPDKFWSAATEAFGEAPVERLRIDGKLAFLTLNNAPLIAGLHETAGDAGVTDTAQLIAAGFHRASQWRSAIGAGPVPPEIPGDNAIEKQDRYAELLAAQLRLSHPTAVLAQMVKDGDTPVAGARLRSQVHAFLSANQDRFEIGMQPIGQFLAQNPVRVDAAVVGEVARIQRVHQISPDDQAMNGLLKEGMDSAAAAMRYDRDEFVRVYGDAAGGADKARAVHDKAQQVHMAVLNLAATYLTAKNASGSSLGPLLDPAPSEPPAPGDVLAYATLESLFGEMDFCGCDHCRSVLSPAAYLVDLLLFLDRPANLDPAPVDPAPSGSATPPPPRPYLNPQDVLLERRPDISHLALTCENTNVALPYIDIVNETLEHYVVNGLSLDDYRGHNVDGRVAPEELLASPQFVTDTAYAELADPDKAAFPPPLPFHRPLEALRRHFARFEAPLDQAMAALRRDESLERASDTDYGWRDVRMETLGLSRGEHTLLTESVSAGGGIDVMATVKRLYGFDSATGDDDVRSALTNAKTFCRRVGISYEALAALLRTEFVNPASGLLPRLGRLGISFAELKQLKAGPIGAAEFEAMLAPGADPGEFGGDIRARLTDDSFFDRVMGLLVLANPDDPEDICNFDRVEIRPADPDPAARLRDFDFVRLIRFIRLWKKLGWTLEQTDRAACALYPPALAPLGVSDALDLARFDSGFRDMLAALGVARRAAGLLTVDLGKDLPSLLACFAPIDMHGDSSLYRRMFVNRAQPDPAFAADGDGAFLTDTGGRILKHRETLRGAFAITGQEFDSIVAELAYDSNTPLTPETISAIFRRGWLARRLKISVRELLLLIRFTGCDPFGPPDPADSGLLRLIDLIARMRAVELKPAHALDLVWNQDLSGKPRPGSAEVGSLARSLRQALDGVERDFARVDDPNASVARARMALVYGSEAADLFFALLDESYETAVEYGHGKPELELAIAAAAPGRIAYDDFAKRLSYTGVLTDSARNALKAVAGVPAAFQAAVDALFDKNKKAVDAFFGRFPDLRPHFDAYTASADSIEARRAALLESILADLKDRRRRQQALQTVGAAGAVDVAMVSALLEDATVLEGADGPSSPALDDFIALGEPGLEAHFFFSASAGGLPDLVQRTAEELAYGPGRPSALPPKPVPGSAISGRWLGYVEAPDDGLYQIRIDTEAGATATLMLDGKPVPLTQAGGSWRNNVPIELRSGRLHAFALIVVDIGERLVVRWGTSSSGIDVVPSAQLYSATLIENLRRAYLRLLKAAALSSALGLGAAEMAHLGALPGYRIGGHGWLNSLPIIGSSDTATSAGLFKAFAGLLDHAGLKKDLAVADDRLLEAVRDPEAATIRPDSLLFTLAQWDDPSLEALLARFGKTKPNLGDPSTLRRFHDAFVWARKLAIPVTALTVAVTNEPSADTVRAFQSALRARYDEGSWLEVLKPINDEMRSLQRDALVACILHRMSSKPKLMHIDTPDKLFEYFLMDVQMAPCTLISRIRLALSSVQLFIERSFMNLEPKVLPSSLNRAHWPWMKRYRLWEANRKVFLYPENWAEPELRDDQSPFFREAMSELLQGDITEDRAAEALLGYLTKLEDVAKLEICGVHHVENSAGTADDVEHVIGRTAGGNRKYFHRRRQGGSWTPWEKVNLDIEDDPVLPVVWRNRLFLVWLKLLKETVSAGTPAAPPDGQQLADVNARAVFTRNEPTLTLKAILQWSELAGGKWQPPRTSDPANPLLLGEDIPLADAAAVRSSLTLFARSGARELEVIASYAGGQFLPFSVWRMPFGVGGLILNPALFVRGSSFLLYNPFSAPELAHAGEPLEARVLKTGGTSFSIEYRGPAVSQTLLTNPIPDRGVQPRHPTAGNAWDSPFYYEDRRHAFRVTSSERTVTLATWDRFGIFAISQAAQAALPPLVTRLDKDLAGRVRPDLLQPRPGVADPRSIELFTSGQDRIRTAIATAETVRFGDVDVDAGGGLFNVARP